MSDRAPAHVRAWEERWAAGDVTVERDGEARRALHFAIYHLVSAGNPEDERVSIGARALAGDAYLGHVFWDTDVFLLPFYTFAHPVAARALLMDRYHTLPAARVLEGAPCPVLLVTDPQGVRPRPEAAT